MPKTKASYPQDDANLITGNRAPTCLSDQKISCQKVRNFYSGTKLDSFKMVIMHLNAQKAVFSLKREFIYNKALAVNKKISNNGLSENIIKCA